MINDQIEDQLDAALVTFGGELFQIVHGSEVCIYSIIIGCVIFVIRRRSEDGGKPDSVYSETESRIRIAVVQIIEAVDHAAKIAYAVTV